MSFITDIVSNYVLESEVSAIKEMSMLSANIEGAVSLAWGLPSFRTPEYIRDGIKQLLDSDIDAGKYTLPDGLPELRRLAVTEHIKKTGIEVDADENVMISAGNMQALNTLFHTMLDPGDEIILTDPCFASHIQQITLFDGKPVYWPLDESNNWALDIERLPALITDKTQAIVIVSPSNPTGKIFSREELLRVGEIARQHDILIIIDDPYSDFVYDNRDKYFNLASVEALKEHIVYLYSFSKSYAMTGWRVGYTAAPKTIIDEMEKLMEHMVSGVTAVAQRAALAAITASQDCVKEMVTIYDKRRHLVHEGLNAIEGIDCLKPESTFYAFPNISSFGLSSWDFAKYLAKEHKVAVVPGSIFGKAGEGYVRLSFAASSEQLREGIARIEKGAAAIRARKG